MNAKQLHTINLCIFATEESIIIWEKMIQRKMSRQNAKEFAQIMSNVGVIRDELNDLKSGTCNSGK